MLFVGIVDMMVAGVGGGAITCWGIGGRGGGVTGFGLRVGVAGIDCGVANMEDW